jgi:hypothetical protein
MEKLNLLRFNFFYSRGKSKPLPKLSPDKFEGDLWFVIEKSGLDDTELTGYVEITDD